VEFIAGWSNSSADLVGIPVAPVAPTPYHPHPAGFSKSYLAVNCGVACLRYNRSSLTPTAASRLNRHPIFRKIKRAKEH
jgi:hypothetical protein